MVLGYKNHLNPWNSVLKDANISHSKESWSLTHLCYQAKTADT